MSNQKSLKKNAFFAFIKAFMNLAFPLITFPYASRILNPDGIGKINFANSVVAFFVTIGLLGTNSYAAREAAKIREDQAKLSQFSREILCINLFSTCISYIFFFFLIFTVPKFSDYIVLLLICSTKILFTIFGMDWLYTATEEFKYITIRSIIFQLLSLIFLFVFVHTPEDLYWYAAFGIFSAVGSNICNFINSRNYITIFQKCRLEIKKHLKPIFIFFGMTLVTNIYTVLDTTMLGFLTTDTEVGYYSAATKIVKMVIGMLTAVSAILLPRLSYHAEKEQFSAFSSLIEKSISIFWMISIPICVGLFLLAEPVLLLFSGGNFINALEPMRIITPIIFIISTASLLGSPLSAMRKEKISLIAVCIGAGINLICNVLLIPKYGASGAAVGTVIAESSVTLFQAFFLATYFRNKRIWSNFIQIIFATFIMGICVYFSTRISVSIIIRIITGFVTGIFSYATILLLLKNYYFCDTLKKLLEKIYGGKRNA
ncbi:flippase [Treponema ruminis]|uniref:O-antigen/teichoic acid export membrane protein n=1 Tax=Treponema ruminis TaxID=744515 RepID=A0A7W8G7M3_9SPIR|nr:flippase [Treponema ruminis]MBB5225252.1 O-antigen/teichoic acid export membrane protein [Treponema ruminis]QSI01877.1 flippase [Treponema ruminis]